MGYNATLSKAKKGEGLVLKGVTLMYVKHTGYGALKFGEEEVKGKPWVNHQYECDVLLTKEMCKALRSANKKVAIKDFSAKAFKDTFKIDPPFEAEKYYTTKLYKEAFYKSGSKEGEEAPRVRVVDKSRNSLEETEVGNGSVGNVVVNITDYDNKFGKGKSIRLGAIQITELVEYNAGSALDEFDFEDEDDFDGDDDVPFDTDDSSDDDDGGDPDWD